MPKNVDYIGRFAFFEEAAFAIVRDDGVHRLSRHRMAAVLGTSISTIRRVLAGHADLRMLALREAQLRRRAGRWGRPSGEPVEVAEALLRRLLPDSDARVAEELVWWRVAVTAPTAARVTTDADHPDGPLRDRFAIATWGYVPRDLEDRGAGTSTSSTDPIDPTYPDDHAVPAGDSVATALADHDEDVSATVAGALGLLGVPEGPEGGAERERTRALVDGLGVAVCLGRLTPESACAVLRDHLERLAAA
jgi:hypothetical protein